MRRWLVVSCLAGCWAGTDHGDTAITNVTTEKPGLLTLHTTGFGPIDASTVATLENLRKLFPGYEVRPVNDPNLEYDIFTDTVSSRSGLRGGLRGPGGPRPPHPPV